MDHIPTSNKSSKIDEFSKWIQTRKPVLRGMYFYDDPNINVTKDLNYQFKEFASKVWMESYSIFEADIRTVIDYISNLCEKNQIEIKENKNYNNYLDLLIDLQALSEYQLLKLKKLNLKDIEHLSHDYRLRMTFEEMESYIKNRNIVYLVFITMMQYSINVEEEFKYLLLVISFLILLNKSDDLTSMDKSYQVLDLSIYEISRILNLNNQKRFDNLVAYGLQINNKKGIDNIIIELLPILQSGVKNDTLKDMIGFIDDTVLKLFSQLLNNQKVNIGFTQIDVKTNMEAVDLAKLSPEIFSSSPLAHEVIQDLIRSKAHSDRYKSEYSRSQISKHQINTLLSQKTKCLLEWVRNNCNDFQVIYHIHEILNSGDLIICNLDMHLFIVELYRILPKLEESQITQELEIHQLYNTKSNLLHLSGPGYIHDKFSPKFGISRVRIQPATIVDNNTNIFKKNDRLDLSVYQSREPIFKIIQASEQLQQTKLSLPEILSLLEHLIENDIAKKYQIDNFQGKTIVFLVLDIIQQQNLLENETETSNKLKSLFENQNLLTVLLI